MFGRNVMNLNVSNGLMLTVLQGHLIRCLSGSGHVLIRLTFGSKLNIDSFIFRVKQLCIL